MLAGVQPYSDAIISHFLTVDVGQLQNSGVLCLADSCHGQPLQSQFRKTIRIERIRNSNSCIC